jgi:ribosomal protein S27E
MENLYKEEMNMQTQNPDTDPELVVYNIYPISIRCPKCGHENNCTQEQAKMGFVCRRCGTSIPGTSSQTLPENKNNCV